MGYTTDFIGGLQFNKQPTAELKDYINKFSYTRRMRRNPEKIKECFTDWQEHCFNGQLGTQGEFFVGGRGLCGQEFDKSVVDFNAHPTMQPGLWCCWVINDKDELVWNGTEKFYNYTDWLKYLITAFFEPEGYVLNGAIYFQGEDADDTGIITVKDNIVKK